MFRIRGSERDYAWGSTTAIPDLVGDASDDDAPVAELWFGSHPAAPSGLPDGEAANLRELLLGDSRELLGGTVLARFGQHLPYLLKLIAPARPLSLQIHPNLEQARAGFDREEAAAVPRGARERTYRDANHKPELLYALTPFRVLCGFRTPRRALEMVSGLEVPLARRLAEILQAAPTAEGVQEAVTLLLTPDAVSRQEVEDVVPACAARAGRQGGSVRIDRAVGQLGKAFPGDPGAVTALLLNPVTLQPGEALFVPPGTPHAYLEGLGVEVMANSDNVLRAGLTAKHIDPAAVLEVMDFSAAPPLRVAPEINGPTKTFYAPVEDFELSVTALGGAGTVDLPGRGPRIVLVISGQAQVSTGPGEGITLWPGQAVFVPAEAGPVRAHGEAQVVQAAVP